MYHELQFNTFAESSSHENREDWINVSVEKLYIFIIQLCILFKVQFARFVRGHILCQLGNREGLRSSRFRSTCSGSFSLCYDFVLTSMSLSERPLLYNFMSGSLKV